MAKKETYGGAGAAGAFFTAAQEPETAEQERQPITYTRPAREMRSKRTSFLIQPSLHEKAAKKAAELNISVNELIIRAIVEYLEKH